MGIIGVSSSRFIIISAGVILMFVLYLFLLSLSKKKNKKRERELRKYANRLDVMDRVKPGEIKLERKQAKNEK